MKEIIFATYLMAGLFVFSVVLVGVVVQFLPEHTECAQP
jgi:hypothetical protein